MYDKILIYSKLTTNAVQRNWKAIDKFTWKFLKTRKELPYFELSSEIFF